MVKVPPKKRKHILLPTNDELIDENYISSSRSSQSESPQDISTLISPPQTPPIQNSSAFSNRISSQYVIPNQPFKPISTSQSVLSMSGSASDSGRNPRSSVYSCELSSSEVSRESGEFIPLLTEAKSFNLSTVHQDVPMLTAEPANKSLPVTTSSFAPRFNHPTRPNLPDELMDFLPLNIFQNSEETSLSSEASTNRKGKKFIYKINGQPLNEKSKKSLAGCTRPRNVARSVSNQLTNSAAYENNSVNYLYTPNNTLQSDRCTHSPQTGQCNDYRSDDCVASTSNGKSVHRPPVLLTDEELNTLEMNPNKKKKKSQECRYCANHELYIPVKGHKYNCEYRNCGCEFCEITRQRQIAVREQQKQTRRQEALRMQQEQDPDAIEILSDSEYTPPSFMKHSRRLCIERDGYYYPMETTSPQHSQSQEYRHYQTRSASHGKDVNYCRRERVLSIEQTMQV